VASGEKYTNIHIYLKQLGRFTDSIAFEKLQRERNLNALGLRKVKKKN
jgi:hypothetical protein